MSRIYRFLVSCRAILLVALLVGVVACDSDFTRKRNPLIGTWQVIGVASIELGKHGVAPTVEFREQVMILGGVSTRVIYVIDQGHVSVMNADGTGLAFYLTSNPDLIWQRFPVLGEVRYQRIK